MRVIPFLKAPAFTLQAVFTRSSRFAGGTPECLRCLGMPQVHGSSQKLHGGPAISRPDRGDLWAPRGTAAAWDTRAWDTHLLAQEPGHQQITAQTRVQGRQPLAFSGSRLENALGREPCTQQYSAPLTFLYLDAGLNKSKRYRIRRGVLLGMVIGICCALGQSCSQIRTFKNPRSEVFSFPLWQLYESLKNKQKTTGKKKVY